jgi:hypothetical protein
MQGTERADCRTSGDGLTAPPMRKSADVTIARLSGLDLQDGTITAALLAKRRS